MISKKKGDVPEHLADAVEWIGRSESERGEALRDLLRVADRVMQSRREINNSNTNKRKHITMSFNKKKSKSLTKKRAGDNRQKTFDGPKETLEEFLARGGEITILPPKLGPDVMPNNIPRPPLTSKGKYEV
jgi:hypothetical protein